VGEKSLIVLADADGEHIPVEREVPSPFNGGCKTLAVS
jgi:hypothetical protein